MTTEFALITRHGLDDVLAWRPSGPVRVRDFLADAQALAAHLPAGAGLLNLCEDRYRYAVGFAAGLLAGKVSLQPSSQSVETLARVADQYPGVACLADTPQDLPGLPLLAFPERLDADASTVTHIPMVGADRCAAVLFTSGSTGLPQPHRKTWGKLVANGRAEARALGLLERPHTLVGTVPAQHSYGFESTFLLALHGGCSFWSGKPFYPQDVVAALQAVPAPRLLVTTPYHLSAVLASGVAWPAVERVLSATAPLSTDLARRVEAVSGAPLHEIYGSTESSALASRRTTDGDTWTLLPDVALEQADDLTWASQGHVEGRVPLTDAIELLPERRFLLHGRHADLVNIAGKRTSLAYLNHQLTAVDGVQDAAFFLPDTARDDGITRLTAFVVAEPERRPEVLAAMRQRIDPVFLPRPLVWVDRLPRNPLGKLPRSGLQALYAERVGHDRA